MRPPLYYRAPLLTRVIWFLVGAVVMAAIMCAVVVAL